MLLFLKVLIKDGHEKEVLEVLTWEVAESRKETGCIRFDVCKHDKEERTYNLYEVYDDQAALDFHHETVHFKKIWALKEAGKFVVVSKDDTSAYDL